MSKHNKIMVRPGIHIGYADATEDSEFLDNCYIENGTISNARDIDNPGCIILGRTGSGKSAALYKIKSLEENCIELNPSDLSLSFVSNSTIIRFFHDLGVDLDLFFQLLWRHVLVLELLNKKYNIKNKSDFEHVLDQIKMKVGLDRAKKLSLEYLTEWGSKFWQDTEVRVKEIVEKFEHDLKVGVGFDAFNTQANANLADTLSKEQKSEVVHLAKNVVSQVQIKKLSNLMDIMADEIFNDRQQKYFILIDRLDEDWVDDDLRYRLIRALIETLKAFRKVRSVKILVALRYDLMERTFRKTKSPGFQREKFEDFIIPISWQKDQLIQLISDRIGYVYKRKYTTESVVFNDVFPKRYRKNSSIVDHLTHRTQFRPRDIIAFTNLIFAKSSNSEKISASTIDEAEKEYSDKRRQAMLDEWTEEHPNLSACLEVLRGMPSRFKISEISNEHLDHCIMELSESNKKLETIQSMAAAYINSQSNSSDRVEFTFELAAILYKVGAIGVKTRHIPRVSYAYQHPYDLDKKTLSPDTYISVSPMLWHTLQIARKRSGEIVS